MGKQQPASYYDKVFATSEHYSINRSGYDCIYTPMFNHVVSLLAPIDRIVELGCGTGQLAEMIIDKGYRYLQGVDFSSEAVRVAQERCPTAKFSESDLNDYAFRLNYNTVVATEVFEHIENDLEILGKIKKYAKVILSVPEYDSAGHVRFFPTKADVEARYGHLFSEYTINKIGRIYILNGIKL